MPEQANQGRPLPEPLERMMRRKASPWPLIISLGFLLMLVAGGVFLLFQKTTWDEPWRIPYPGVTWLRGTDSNLKEGKRYLQAEVRFDVEVLSGAEFETFLAALVSKTKATYVYYHIRAQNKRGQYVLDGVVGPNSFRTYYGPAYDDQGGPQIPPKPPGKSPDNAPDESPGETIIIE